MFDQRLKTLPDFKLWLFSTGQLGYALPRVSENPFQKSWRYFQAGWKSLRMGFLNQWHLLCWWKKRERLCLAVLMGRLSVQNSNCKRLWESDSLVEADLSLHMVWNRTAMAKLLKSPRILSSHSPKEHPFSFPDIDQCCTCTERKLSLLDPRRLTLGFTACLGKAIAQWLAKYL